MNVEQIRRYEDLEQYLREFTNWSDAPAPYDFIGAFHLFLAILDNLANNSLEAEVESIGEDGPVFTEKQLNFLQKFKQFGKRD